jgi:hypothetical protein
VPELKAVLRGHFILWEVVLKRQSSNVAECFRADALQLDLTNYANSNSKTSVTL